MKKHHNSKRYMKLFSQNLKLKNIDEYLVLFWSQFQKHKKVTKIKVNYDSSKKRSYKIELLKSMSGIVLSNPDYVERKNKRKGFNNSRDSVNEESLDHEKRIYIIGDKCFVCKEQPHHRHHIIQIQHGGKNIENNIVHLCRSCHKEVHK